MRDRRNRAVVLVVAVAIVAMAGLLAATVLRPRSADERHAAALDLAGHLAVTAEVSASSLGVTHAVADFGVEDGVRMVPVRIVEELVLTVRIASDRDLVLAGPPRVCLVGPFWNPLDAGLSDRCWGEPDLGAIIASRLVPDPAGRLQLRAGQPIDVTANLARGDVRCDYAPGDWRVEVEGELVVDDVVQPRLGLAGAPVIVPLEAGGELPLRPNADTRFCGLATPVYRRQGEPAFREN